MTKDALIARLKGYEWADFECKKAKRSIPDDAYATVSAFANTAGGWLLFGISEEQGQLLVTGIDNDAFDQVQNNFLTVLRSGQKLNRLIAVQPTVHELDGKRVLACFIPASPRHEKPIYLKGNPRNSYIRRGASDEQVTEHELQRFMRDAALKSWDSEGLVDIPATQFFDADTLQWYQTQFYQRHPEKKAITEALPFLLEWNFIVEQGQQQFPTRAAVLLFGKDRFVRQLLPRPVLDYQRIDTLFANWSPELRWHDRLLFEENLFSTWRGLVGKYMRIAERPFLLDPATLRRNDDPADYVAFREAAINLLIHQDYGDTFRTPALKIFIDRTVFWNPGDAFATASELLEYSEKELRNPAIVTAFRRIGLSDQAGTGIRAIYRNWHQLGRVPPSIHNNKANKSFELVLVNEPLITPTVRQFQQRLGAKLTTQQAEVLALAVRAATVSPLDVRQLIQGGVAEVQALLNSLVAQQLLLELEPKQTYQLPEHLKALFSANPTVAGIQHPRLESRLESRLGSNLAAKVVLLLREQPLGKIRLAESLGHKTVSGELNKQVKHLLTRQWIEMTLPEKPSSRLQQYRLTAAALDLMTQLEQVEHG